MIIEGSFDSLKASDSFNLVDEYGEEVLNIKYNKFLPDKLYIKNPSNDKEYIGEIIHNHDTEEFIFHEETTQLFHVWQKSGMGMPKFEIKSSLGDFKTKFVLRKRNIILLDGDKETATIVGSPPNYKIIIEDNDDTFLAICITFAITTLVPFKSMYSLIS